MKTSSTLRRTPWRNLLLALATLAAVWAAPHSQAAVVHDMRDHFESIAGSVGVQSGAGPWTFHTGNAGGALLVGNGSSYRGPVNPQQIGLLVNPGALPCTAGFCGAVPIANTRATFEGVFVHSGSPDATVAVFHAEQALLLDEIHLQSEMVQNGHNGNGMSVDVLANIGGVAQAIGSFNMTYALSTVAAIETIYTPGLTLGAGDWVEVRYGPRGSYLYDHGNVNVRITTSDAVLSSPPSGVPEPQSLALALGSLGMMGWRARQRRRAMDEAPKPATWWPTR